MFQALVMISWSEVINVEHFCIRCAKANEEQTLPDLLRSQIALNDCLVKSVDWRLFCIVCQPFKQNAGFNKIYPGRSVNRLQSYTGKRRRQQQQIYLHNPIWNRRRKLCFWSSKTFRPAISAGTKRFALQCCVMLLDSNLRQTSWYFSRHGSFFNRFWIRDHKTSLATSIEIVMIWIPNRRILAKKGAPGWFVWQFRHIMRAQVTTMPTFFNSWICPLMTGSRRCPVVQIR